MLSIFKKKPVNENQEANLFDLLALPEPKQDEQKLKDIIRRLDDCNSNELNYVACELLRALNYESQIIDGIHDQGIDVIGFKDNKRELAVQCKAWNPKKTTERINVKDVQAFKGRVLSSDYKYGLFITTHYFDDFALKEANENLILIDRKYLLEILTNYFPNAVSNYLYHQDLGTQDACPNCSNGKIIKIYRDAKPSFDWCESCREVPRYKA